MPPSVRLICPAKLNLSLAVTGRREDGFHALVSLVAQVEHGDELEVEWRPAGEGFSLSCDQPDLPTGPENLVMRAAQTFAAATGWRGGAHFLLKKRVPAGAGLGGGSSDAAAVFKVLNARLETPLALPALSDLAARVGSDCPLFLHDGPVVIRGRGEDVTPVTGPAAKALAGQRVLLFKPSFGINTAWAYGRLARGAPASYANAVEAEARLAAWAADPRKIAGLLHNSFEAVAFEKFLALPTLLVRLRERFGLPVMMSGSGSACFALLPEQSTRDEAIRAEIAEAWGDDAWTVFTSIKA